MLLDLIKLYKKQGESKRTPLEDFNTECFAGILKMYPDIKKAFIYSFLKLPKDNYRVLTQVRKNLLNRENCIIDLVLESNGHTCFIENKVESKEGWEQLEYAENADEQIKDWFKASFIQMAKLIKDNEKLDWAVFNFPKDVVRKSD